MSVVRNLSRKKFLALTSALESTLSLEDGSNYDLVICAASQLKDLVSFEDLSLTQAEKIRVLKSVTRAKVRAYLGGEADCYQTFRTLETISSDLVRVL